MEDITFKKVKKIIQDEFPYCNCFGSEYSYLATLNDTTQKIMRALTESSRVEPDVSDDFCGDCGSKFEPGESKIYSGNSAVYGEYFPKSETPICEKCSEKRYEKHIAEYESKNSR